jgi:hypothetical protein
MQSKQTEQNGSSLKVFDFSAWTKEQAIEKYENVLYSREKQITDLTIEMGAVNEKINNLSEKCRQLEHENEILKYRLQKRVINK